MTVFARHVAPCHLTVARYRSRVEGRGHSQNGQRPVRRRKARPEPEPIVPRWLLTVISIVAFVLWSVGWVAEFVSHLNGGTFTAPDGALPLLMLVLGAALAADQLLTKGRRVFKAAVKALGEEPGEDEGHDGTGPR